MLKNKVQSDTSRHQSKDINLVLEIGNLKEVDNL